MPTYSSITIEFLIDFEEDYVMRTKSRLNGVLQASETWTWVTTRSAAYEVTTGTPTATAGERTAINFEAAFDLDHPTDFVTTQTTNVIEIQSETLGYDFVGIKILDADENLLQLGVDFNATFDNYVVPVDTSNIEFALVRSPHYVNLPFFFDTTTSASVDLYVWEGDLTSVPATATYSFTMPRPSTNYEEFNVDLSKLIQESILPSVTITLSSTTQIVDSDTDSVMWVYYTASYTDPEETITDIEGTFVAVDGYGLYNEGVNPTKPSNLVLTSASNRKVSRDGFILFPFINNGTITSIDIDSDGGEINATETMTTSNESTDIVQYIDVDVSQATTDSYITITTQPAGDSFVYEIIDECRYNPIQIVFKNKYGVFDSITLFKKSNDSISVENDEFINNYVTNGTYSTTKHQYQKKNILGRKSIKVNSGYIKESENQLYEELLLSDMVYLYQNYALVPVNVTTSSLEFKTRVNDRLVNYELSFDYAYNVIQNV